MIKVYAFSFLVACITSITVIASSTTDHQEIKTGNDLLEKAEELIKLDKYQEAFRIYKKTQIIFTGTSYYEKLAYTFQGIGKCKNIMGEYDSALIYLNKAAQILSDKQISNRNLIASIWYNKGIAYNYLSKTKESLNAHNKALKIRLNSSPHHPIDIAWSYMAIGDVYRWLKYDYYQAEKYYEQALKQIGNFDRSNNLILLFRLYYDLASLYREKGDLEKALIYAYYDQDIMKEIHSPNNQVELYVLQLIANTLADNKDYEKAIPVFQKMLEILQKDYQGNLLFDKGNFYSNMALPYLFTNRLNTAEYWIRKSIEQYNHLSREDSIHISFSYYYLGILYHKKANHGEALQYLKKSLQIRKNILGQKNVKVSEIYNYMALVYTSLSQYDSAMFYYHQSLISSIPYFNNENIYSLPHSSTITYDYFSLNTLALKANLLLDHYSNNTHAIKTAYKIYMLLDSAIMTRRLVPDWEKSKLEFAGNSRKIYKNAVRCALQLYSRINNDMYYWQAYAFMENSKSQILFEDIRKRKLFEKGVPDSLTNRLYYYQSQIGYLRDKLNTEILQQKPDEDHANKIRADIIMMEKKREKLEKHIIREYIDHNYDFLFNNAPDISQVNRWAGKTNSVVVNYFLEDELFCIFWYDGKQHGYHQIQNMYHIQNSIYALREILDHPDILSKEQYQEFIKIAYDMHTILIKPYVRNAYEQMIIIPDGSLFYLPFEVLLTQKADPENINYKNLSYLLLSQNISYEYSNALLLRSLLTKNNSKKKGVIGFSFSDRSENIGNYAPHRKGTNNNKLNPLPGTANEIEMINNYLTGEFYFGSSATEYYFKKFAPEYNIIHLAVHGMADLENEFNSRLVFNNDQDSVEDGMLHIYELYTMHFLSNLMVLSTCESGMGKRYHGEGMYSIARGVFLAGCPSVVMSLWNIKDVTTTTIMDRFYFYISKNVPVNKALTMSKRDYIRDADEYSAHPACWGAFVYAGNTSAVINRNLQKTICVTITILFLIGMLLLTCFIRNKFRTLK